MFSHSTLHPTQSFVFLSRNPLYDIGTMKYIYALIIVLLTSANALAVSIPFVRNFTNKEVMCQNWDIGQDSKGVIYVANRNGLVCYDGKT